MIAVLLVYVVPQVVSVYQQSRQTLPWLTQALIATSGVLPRDRLAVARGARRRAASRSRSRCRREPFRARWHAALLRDARRSAGSSRSLDTARFASTLAILVGSGAPLLRSLDAARDVVWMLPLRRRGDARPPRCVREGVSLSRALKEQRRVPAGAGASGRQRRGRAAALAPMLERAAGELEREAERRLTWFAALLQPALIVAMGAIVLVLVLAVMLPIVSMNQLIR